MRLVNIFRLRLRSLIFRRRVEQELAEEFQYHLEREIQANIALGMPAEDARRLALTSLEGLEQRKEECRDVRALNLIENTMQDLRYAIRSLARNPGFGLLIVTVMALGIGANTAVFSVVDAVLLKPLAYPEPDRMVALSSALNRGDKSKLVTLPDFQDWHDQSSAFRAMACYRSSQSPVMAGTDTEYVRVARVSAEFFQVLEMRPAIGRLFSAEEQRSGDSATALIGYTYWRSHFGGDPGVLGKTIRVSGDSLAIIGVLPPGFHFPDDTDVWIPLDPVDRTLQRTSFAFLAIARLKPNMSIQQAQGQLKSVATRLERQFPDSNKGRTVEVTGMLDEMVGGVRLTLYLIFGAVGMVLLIACANVATLLLSKATARSREIAIRAAVGAGRGRIVRQLIVENLLLAFIAGAAGLIVATGGTHALIALAPADVPRLAEAAADRRVLLFTCGVSLVSSLLFGLVPALYASRVALNEGLKQGGSRAVVGGRADWLRGGLVTVEVALAVVLLAGAGLLLKSFAALHNVALGFRPQSVLLMKASLPVSGPDGDIRARIFFRQLLSSISSLPGVSAAGATMGPPGHVESAGSYWIDHLPQPTVFQGQNAVFSVVTPGTFQALGIPLKRGRDFRWADSASAPFTAVINETLAREQFPNQDPIGRTIFAGFDSFDPMRIVGIVGDVRQWGPARKPDPEIYMPYEQHPGAGSALSVVVRTSGPPEALSGTLRRMVHDASANVPVKFTTMEASLNEDVAAPRFRSFLLALLAALSLGLAIAGVYGVTAYAVSQRSNEIGLRMALGATRGNVVRLVIKQGLGVAAVGMTVGIACSLAAASLMRSLLFEVQPSDPMTFLGVAVLLGLVVLTAGYVPARRASRLDPLSTLRQD